MKRSEMIVKIANFLLEIAPETYEEQSSYGRRLDATALLDCLEVAGMAPPPTEFEFETDDDRNILFFNEWEPEDDAKT